MLRKRIYEFQKLVMKEVVTHSENRTAFFLHLVSTANKYLAKSRASSKIA